MGVAITAVFYLHTFLCAGYLAYLIQAMGTWAGHRNSELTPGFGSLAGMDERVLTLTSHATLLLYLGYAEIYLYHSINLLGR